MRFVKYIRDQGQFQCQSLMFTIEPPLALDNAHLRSRHQGGG